MKNVIILLSLTVLLSIAFVLPGCLGGGGGGAKTAVFAPDSTGISQTVEGFSSALAQRDFAKAQQFFSPQSRLSAQAGQLGWTLYFPDFGKSLASSTDNASFALQIATEGGIIQVSAAQAFVHASYRFGETQDVTLSIELQKDGDVWFIVDIILEGASISEFSPAQFLPLQAGNRWIYGSDSSTTDDTLYLEIGSTNVLRAGRNFFPISAAFSSEVPRTSTKKKYGAIRGLAPRIASFPVPAKVSPAIQPFHGFFGMEFKTTENFLLSTTGGLFYSGTAPDFNGGIPWGIVASSSVSFGYNGETDLSLASGPATTHRSVNFGAGFVPFDTPLGVFQALELNVVTTSIPDTGVYFTQTYFFVRGMGIVGWEDSSGNEFWLAEAVVGGRHYTPPVEEDLAIVSASGASGTIGLYFQFDLVAKGGSGNYSWQALDDLPDGLVLLPGGNQIHGTPTEVTRETVTIRLVDQDDPEDFDEQELTIEIAAQPQLLISSPNHASGTAGVNFNFIPTATGGLGPYTWSITGDLPPGISLFTAADPEYIDGICNIGTTAVVVLEVQDSIGDVATQTFTLEILPQPPLVISSPNHASGSAGVNFNFIPTATGGFGSYTWSITGDLPPGISLFTAADPEYIDGICNIGTTTVVILQVTDDIGGVATQAFTLEIVPPAPLTITSPNHASGTAGVNFNFTPTATGGFGSYTWSITGDLPPGISLFTAADPEYIDGICNIGTTTVVILQVTDDIGGVATQAFTLEIVPQATLTITSADHASGTAQSPFQFNLFAAGGLAPYSWSLTGDLPPGISLFTAATPNYLDGTCPIATIAVVMLEVHDSIGGIATQAFALQFMPPGPLGFANPASLPPAIVNDPYSFNFIATGGTPPYTWSMDPNGAWGFSGVAENAQVFGTPNAPGNTTFTIHLTDQGGSGSTINREFGLKIFNYANASATYDPSSGNLAVQMFDSAGAALPINTTNGTETFRYQVIDFQVAKNDATRIATPTTQPGSVSVSGNVATLSLPALSWAPTTQLVIHEVTDTSGQYMIRRSPIPIQNRLSFVQFIPWSTFGESSKPNRIRVFDESMNKGYMVYGDHVKSFDISEVTVGGKPALAIPGLTSGCLSTTTPPVFFDLYCGFDGGDATLTALVIATDSGQTKFAFFEEGLNTTDNAFHFTGIAEDPSAVYDGWLDFYDHPAGVNHAIIVYNDWIHSVDAVDPTISYSSVQYFANDYAKAFDSNGSYECRAVDGSGTLHLLSANNSGVVTATAYGPGPMSHGGLVWMTDLLVASAPNLFLSTDEDNNILRLSSLVLPSFGWQGGNEPVNPTVHSDYRDVQGRLKSPRPVAVFLSPRDGTNVVDERDMWILVGDEDGLQVFRKL